MKIVNLTKKTMIAEEVEKAESFWKKAKGLMFRKSLPEGKAILLIFEKEGNHGIWMPFMRFPIDAIFLDSRKRVVKIHENIQPMSLNPKTWKIYHSKPVKYIIEMNAFSVKTTKTETGDIIEFRN